MPNASEYEDRIRTLSHDGLLRLWEEVETGETPGWEPGKLFEYLVVRAFEIEGAKVRYPFSVSLHDAVVEQIDGVVYTEGIAALIEAKDVAEPVNVEPIAKLRNQLARRPSSAVGVVFSRTGFTAPAKTLTRFVAPQTILLWHGDELAKSLSTKRMTSGLLTKYHYAIESGVPDYHLIAEGAL
jgi:hypothetical protein